MNICTRRKITVRDISFNADGSVNASVERRSFKLLRPIAYKTHTRVHIVNKRGFYNLKRVYGKRFGLTAGAVVCAAFFLAAPRFIWTVKISGCDRVSSQDIERSLKDAGVYPGALKSSVPDGFSVKNAVLADNPGLLWAWVYIKGTTADVRVYEKDMPPAVIDRNEPCSIAAACDAYVKSVRALNGERVLNTPGVVRAGEILVSGRVGVYREGYPEKYMYVHARAETVAYTQRTESGIYSLEYEKRTPTGRAVSKPYIIIFGKRFNLYRDGGCDYEEYDSEDFAHSFMGITAGGTRFSEVETVTEPMSVEGALREAKDELEEKTAAKLCRNVRLLDEDLQYEYISDKEIKVKLTMSFEEDIGTEVPVETEESTIDKQEN